MDGLSLADPQGRRASTLKQASSRSVGNAGKILSRMRAVEKPILLIKMLYTTSAMSQPSWYQREEVHTAFVGVLLLLSILSVMAWTIQLLGPDGFIPYQPHASLGGKGGVNILNSIWTAGALIPLSWVFLDARARKIRRPWWYWAMFAIVAQLGVYFGGRAFHYLGPWGKGWWDWEGFLMWKAGGSVFYGGLVGLLAASVAYLRLVKEKFPLLLLDVIAPAISFTSFFTRILTCFYSGDDFGTRSALPWAIKYVSGPHLYLLYQTLHPVQLYLALGNLLVFIALLEVRRRKLIHGTVFAAYAILYPIMRFSLEFFRDPTESRLSPLLHMTYSQVISIVLFAFGLCLLFFLNKVRIKKVFCNMRHTTLCFYL
ncbi:prolipoprotein diacylglyceryl transferase [Candidatus Uhrbacteria bacterium]|nr:prolipoprotein diacylglyceryl transferase [Candidatus Uhrbacteria bacterium]